MTCADCKQPMRASIRGIPKCAEHYIEALEHSAHITSFVTGDDHPIIVQMPFAKKVVDNKSVLC